MLSDAHLRMLHDESGITSEVIAARGYRTVTKKAELAKLGFSMAQRLPPALVLPIYNPYGEIVLYQARPDTPESPRRQTAQIRNPRQRAHGS
jgi:hypothetical protein